MRRAFFAAVGTVLGLVMLLSFKTHGSRPSNLSALGAVGKGTSSGPAPTTHKTTAATGAAPATSRTITGRAVDTAYGPVQIAITLQGGRIVRVQPLQAPSGGRSDDITSYSLPILMQETLKAQSAHIDSVSGASYTSDGYVQSLQSALDQAHA